jgi:hypothetical protein
MKNLYVPVIITQFTLEAQVKNPASKSKQLLVSCRFDVEVVYSRPSAKGRAVFLVI